MGNGSSVDPCKTVFVEINGKKEKIVFNRYCNSQDIVELLAQAAGVNRSTIITLRNSDGALVTISPSMPSNIDSKPYKLTTTESKKEPERVSENSQMLQSVLSQVSDHFNSLDAWLDDGQQPEDEL